ncbi:estradiol 17-beta-dehydrogenase 2-like isoform X2 [Erythrolamprus reginae]|uniref:estradiol 17-beta-dehydrogenase 2-like isoform X2 n=1 Tax=Erythrolamprus reginae TaxID=121349 RepID=UPI00396C66EA
MAQPVDFCVFSVLVTGSNRGIGLGLVKRFLELPSPPQWVFATTLDLEGKENKELRELACKYPNLVVLQLDVTKPESIQAALNEVQKCVGEGGLTILYNNAGIFSNNDLQTENAKVMMEVYSVNTIGPLQMSQAFLPLLKKAARRSPCQGLSASKAAIINMSSIAGSIELMAHFDQYQVVAYRCAKISRNNFLENSSQEQMFLTPNFSEAFCLISLIFLHHPVVLLYASDCPKHAHQVSVPWIFSRWHPECRHAPWIS